MRWLRLSAGRMIKRNCCQTAAVQLVGKPCLCLIKVFDRAFFKKLAGLRDSVPRRCPQAAKLPISIKKALKIGAWGKENKSFPSPHYQSFAPLLTGTNCRIRDFICKLNCCPKAAVSFYVRNYFFSLRRSRISVSRTSSLEGSAGFSSSFFLPMDISLLTALTIRKMQNAMMMKLMTAVTK